MKDLKFEQKRSLSRTEAADQLSALADALREGGEAELELGAGTLSLRIPDELRSELEFEVGDGEFELEIELKWPTGRPRRANAEPAAAPAAKATKVTRAPEAADTAETAQAAQPARTAKAPAKKTARKTATKTSRSRKRATAKPA
ncbi:amphi-Trp domain-containing protein [Streptomyces sp. NPDC101115]|uniref:amphi-Trp domain-containing protein n=1 Tax=Streptomyces sp. NPDC101115 TaxID=3366106 RepID=UPI0037FCC1C3